MIYLSWAALYEGGDEAYFDSLIPRVMEDAILRNGVQRSEIPASPALRLSRGAVEEVAKQACDARDAFHIVFIHADTGGRNLEAQIANRSRAYCEAMHARCDWPPARCIIISPRHETEGWILADPGAVASVLGYVGSPASIGLPADAREAERLVDPKAVLNAVANQIRGRRRPFEIKRLFPAIAQRQSLALLRQTQSFAAFEADLAVALASLGCLRAP